MSTILESVNTLSDKLGVTEREQTIKDQLDLCVERLGGEGNSKDIADSAEKFAEKEDGTATFMTKTITENNTYNAADDGVSGYSSVTVNVPSAPTPETFEVNVTADIGDEMTITFSKNRSEMLEAYDAGKTIIGTCTLIESSNTTTVPVKSWSKSNSVNGTDEIFLYSDFYTLSNVTTALVFSLFESGSFLAQTAIYINPDSQ